VRRFPAANEKPLFWVGSSKRDLLAFPDQAIGEIGWAVYTVRFERAVYVLHCFQKKSPTGIKTTRLDIEYVHRRLAAAEADYEARYGQEQK